jgi:hypothetical protein
MRADTRIVQPEGAAIAMERPINAFPRQRTLDATVEELLETVFSTGSVARLCSQRIQSDESYPRVEASSNTSTVALRFVRGNEK